MADHYSVTKQLKDLSSEELIGVGGALGLYYPNLRRMNPLLEEMVAAWLNRKDNVLSCSGDPSWVSLVKVLQDLCHPGIAKTISDGKATVVRSWYIIVLTSNFVFLFCSLPTTTMMHPELILV